MMDINTKRGQSSLNYERDAIEKFSLIHPEYRFIETPKDRPAAVDGVFMKGGVLHSVLEVKVRNLTRAMLRDSFDDTWLVTMDKGEAGRVLSRLLRIPFVGMLYLLPEERLLTLRITDEKGEWALDFDTKETVTQKCINGGEATRLNAFLPLATAREHK